MQIDMWIARIWEYLLAAGFYWWVALAVLLMLERLAERTFHGFWGKRIDPWFTPDRRKQVLVFFALAAFVIANFRAFDVEREAKEHAIAERQNVPLDPMVLYQDGFHVASIIEPRIDALANTMVFPLITASRELDISKEFEFRRWKLLCAGGVPTGVAISGAAQQITYPNFTCRIEGIR